MDRKARKRTENRTRICLPSVSFRAFRGYFLPESALERIRGHRLAAVAGPHAPPDLHGDRVLHEGDVPVAVEGIRPPGMRAAGGPGALVDEPAVGAGVVV